MPKFLGRFSRIGFLALLDLLETFAPPGAAATFLPVDFLGGCGDGRRSWERGTRSEHDSQFLVFSETTCCLKYAPAPPCGALLGGLPRAGPHASELSHDPLGQGPVRGRWRGMVRKSSVLVLTPVIGSKSREGAFDGSPVRRSWSSKQR